MARAERDATTRNGDPGSPSRVWPLPDGEIHYLWWFIQGSIMEPEMRGRLRRTWGALAVEAAYRHGYLHGPAVGLRAFGRETRPCWGRTVRGPCLGRRTAPRCRPHLVETFAREDSVALRAEGELTESIRVHVTAYARSFRWERRDTETDGDRAALVSAVGWYSGCRAWLPLLTGRPSPEDRPDRLAPRDARPAPAVDVVPVG
jgi:hypothetical protein